MSKRGKQPQLKWEFGDVVLWVQFGDDDPFPVDIYRTGITYEIKMHSRRPLSVIEQEELNEFLAHRASDIMALWPEGFGKKIRWPKLTNE